MVISSSLEVSVTTPRRQSHWRRGLWLMLCEFTIGPLVEFAPGRLACSDSSAIKTIYSSHEWRKSHFYSDIGTFLSVSSLFSETNPPRAQMLRRAFLPAFSRANILSMSPVIFAHIQNFLKKLDEFEARGKPLECYRWFRYLTFEVVSKCTPVSVNDM